jgi:hypothetical protein
MKFSSVYLYILVAATAGCNSKKDPFKPVPECMGAAVVPFTGDRQMVVSTLGIADPGQGFDLDLDGKIDNKLGPLASLANAQINTSFKKGHDIVIPVEMFGYMGQADSMCTKMAFYLGQVNKDRDGDGKNTNWSNGDCMDTDPTIHPGAVEIMDNRVDDDCDGFADNAMPMSKPTGPGSDQDLDGDGVTPAQGDCDDRNDAEHLALAKSRHPGAKDICDDGIDQDCDGIPDNDPSCDPFGDNNVKIDLQSASFVDATAMPLVPNIAFKEGVVMANVLSAGPDLFSINVPFRGGMPLSLQLTGARVQMTLSDDGSKTHAMGGLLGGVLNAASLSQISGIDAGGVIKADQSLLDAVFVGPVATILGLDQDMDNHYLPDIDVDGDGLETFYNSNGPLPSGSIVVDTCKDGDGTIVMSTPDLPCPLAKDKNGKPRFVDGLSAALRFTAVPAQLNTQILP